jgi:hypothetical protein
MSVRIRKAQPPWLREGERDRWIPVSQFARLIVMRSPKTVWAWLRTGDVLPEFGYRAFRDARGRWRIQIKRSEVTLLDR